MHYSKYFVFTGSLGQLITTPANPPQNSAANSNNSPQSIINKLNLSPAKTKNDLSNADKDLAALRSSLAAKKAGLSPSRMSLHSGYEGHKNLKCINMGLRLFVNILATEIFPENRIRIFLEHLKRNH